MGSYTNKKIYIAKLNHHIVLKKKSNKIQYLGVLGIYNATDEQKDKEYKLGIPT